MSPVKSPITDEAGRCAITKSNALKPPVNLYPISDFDLLDSEVSAAYNSFENYTTERVNSSNWSISQDRQIYDATSRLNDGNQPFVGVLGEYNLKVTPENPTPDVVISIGKEDVNIGDYPLVAKRLTTSGIINPFEVIEIVNSTVGYTYTNINSLFESSPNFFYERYERVLSGSYANAAVGSFCQMIPDIIGLTQHFVNFFDNIKSLAGKFSDIKDKVRRESAKLVTLISGADSMVEKIFTEKLNELKNMNLVDFIVGVVPGRIATRFMAAKALAQRFFSEENLKAIKDKIRGMVAYAISFFESPSLEELNYILKKFCALISSVEAMVNGVLNPTKNMLKSYEAAKNGLAASSNANTARAIAAGARRFQTTQSQPIRNRFQENLVQSSQENNNSYSYPIDSSEVGGVTEWNNGRGDSRISFQGGWVAALGESAWLQTDNRVKVMLMRLQARVGRPLIVNSCFRSQAYNTRVGGASKSLHMSGIALDITWAGFRNASNAVKRDFIAMAKQEGFSGFGGYAGFIHIDIGNARSWGIKY